MTTNGYRVSSRGDEKVLELDSGQKKKKTIMSYRDESAEGNFKITNLRNAILKKVHKKFYESTKSRYRTFSSPPYVS